MREVGAQAFYSCEQLKSVTLNEGLQRLGTKEAINGIEYEGKVFYKSVIERIRFPSTLKRIEGEMCVACENLKDVEIPEGVEQIGKWCFFGSKIEEITLPSTLKQISQDTFACCSSLKTIWVEEGCTANIRKDVYYDVKVRHK